jgi:hypothetical protein
MKRYDIGDSYCFGCSSGFLRRGECILQEDDYAALCWQALIQLMRERATSLDVGPTQSELSPAVRRRLLDTCWTPKGRNQPSL